MFVDMGAETTTVSIYKNGTLQYLSTLPLGSRNITRDITALNYIEERAEEIKKAVGNANPSEVSASASAAEGIDTSEINNYVQARAGEILANITEQLNYAGLKQSEIPGGIVIVGGGSKLRGLSQLLANQTKLKVRQGLAPSSIRINDSGIKPDESVDVIALLCAAVKEPSNVACVVIPEHQTPNANDAKQTAESIKSRIVDNSDNNDDEEEDEEEDDDDDNRPQRPGFWSRMRDRVEDLIKGNDDDDFFDDDDK
jgi:cell division protein FtsA